MSKAGALMIGVLPMLVATAAFAQGPVPPAQGTVRVPEALPGQAEPEVATPPAIGSVGGVPVRVWAPVSPPYDPLADRTGAADPIPIGPDWWPATPLVPG
jgi:hypothetical protein